MVKAKTTADKLFEKDYENLTRSQKARYESTKALLELAKLLPWSESGRDYNYVIDDMDREIPLEPDSIEVSYTSKYNAKCGRFRNKRMLTFNMNTDFWVNRSTSEKFGVLAHELVHIRHHHHKPLFWDTLKLFLKRFAKNQDKVEEIMGDEIDFEEVKDKTFSSIHGGSVDRRSESVRERKEIMREIADFGYKYGNQSKVSAVEEQIEAAADEDQ